MSATHSLRTRCQVFNDEMLWLSSMLGAANVSFVKCIRANSEFAPWKIVGMQVLNQVRPDDVGER
jgi:myosin heavy subunit